MTKLSRDQRRRKKLDARKRRTNTLPPRLDRGRVAEAVHRGVCDYTGTDGFCCCAWYALAGQGLLLALSPQQVSVNVGVLRIWPDPASDLCVEMNPERPPEFHAWCVLHDARLPKSMMLTRSGDVIDFSARHFRRYVEEMPSRPGNMNTAFKRPVWRQPELPYVWGTPPEWAYYLANPKQSMELSAAWEQHKELIRLTVKAYVGR